MAIDGKINEDVSKEQYYKQYGLNKELLPKHVAIIMDGNGRWAKANGLLRSKGHEAGSESVRAAVNICSRLGIKYLSVYAFSTENWNRSKMEVSFLMSLFKKMLVNEMPGLHKAGVKIRVIGSVSGLDSSVLDIIEKAHRLTENNTVMQFNIMFNYGSRSEIVEAVQAIVDNKEVKTVTEEVISDHLYEPSSPNPDVLIRTSGEYRLSNFMLWQLAYSELFFLDVLWPDFRDTHFIDVLQQYQNRDRRFGKECHD